MVQSQVAPVAEPITKLEIDKSRRKLNFAEESEQEELVELPLSPAAEAPAVLIEEQESMAEE